MAADLDYGIKCEPDMSLQAEYYHAPSSIGQDLGQEAPIPPGMDLSSFLEMDLSGEGACAAGGVQPQGARGGEDSAFIRSVAFAQGT